MIVHQDRGKVKDKFQKCLSIAFRLSEILDESKGVKKVLEPQSSQLENKEIYSKVYIPDVRYQVKEKVIDLKWGQVRKTLRDQRKNKSD